MCGINGVAFASTSGVHSMNQALKRRGPDGEGVFAEKGVPVTLGHRRLAILDTSPAGHQPQFYHKQQGASSALYRPKQLAMANVGIVFNGEIYNYLEIRDELAKKGYTFTTGSDTEVLLASYLEWGEACLDRFNGMWSFCIYDRKRQILFCSRDRLGVKPFTYFHDPDPKRGMFAFSSDLHGLLAHPDVKKRGGTELDRACLGLYYGLSFVPAPLTVYTSYRKLPAGHKLTYDLRTRKLTTSRYYTLPQYRPQRDRAALLAEGRALLDDAVKLRMRSDVPVGAFLSGGLDSSSVVDAMTKRTERGNLHTYSVKFDGFYDESAAIKLVNDRLQTANTLIHYSDADTERYLKEYPAVFDEPFADFAWLSMLKISSVAAKDITVTLTGDGGDELFGGYGSYTNIQLLRSIMRMPAPLRKASLALITRVKAESDLTPIGKLRELLRWSLQKDTNKLIPNLYPGVRAWSEESVAFYAEKHDELAAHGTYNLVELERLYDLQYNTLGDNFLYKTDRASMHFGLEARCPFLDYRFIEYTLRIPTEWKVGWFTTKKFMRELVKDRVPKALLTLPKKGFTPPFPQYVFAERNRPLVVNACKQLAKRKLVPLEVQTKLEEIIAAGSYSEHKDFVVKSLLLSLWCDKHPVTIRPVMHA